MGVCDSRPVRCAAVQGIGNGSRAAHGHFNPQALANTAWAFATVGQSDAQLFKALAREAERRVGDFNLQNLANTAWAFATVGHKDESLFASSAMAAKRCMGDFNTQNLANTAWAFATAGR